MQAKVRTVAFQGVDVRAGRRAGAGRAGQPRLRHASACPTRRSAKAASGCARRCARWAWRCRRSASPSTSRPPTWPRRAATSTCRSRSALLAAMGVVPRESVAGLRRAGRAVARRLAVAGAGRAAGGARRPRSGARRDLPGGVRRRGRLGSATRCRGDHAAPVAARPGQPSSRPADARRARRPLAADDRGSYPDLAEVKGQEKRQARARDRRGRRPQPADGRPARLGQVDAGGAAARHPAAARAGRGAGGLDDPLAGGRLGDGKLTARRSLPRSAPFGLDGGAGRRRPRARPGEISLAHHGVLFLDELPEFNRAALEALRQPMETGRVTVARANAHVTYPARFQLVAAMNPCRCGHLGTRPRLRPARAAAPTTRAALGPAARPHRPLHRRAAGRGRRSRPAAAGRKLGRCRRARGGGARRPARAAGRVRPQGQAHGRRSASQAAGLLSDRVRNWSKPRCNADTDGKVLAAIAEPDAEGRALLTRAAERLGLSARAWHRTLRVARTLADLDGSDAVRRLHIAEALSYRRPQPRQAMAA